MRRLLVWTLLGACSSSAPPKVAAEAPVAAPRAAVDPPAAPVPPPAASATDGDPFAGKTFAYRFLKNGAEIGTMSFAGKAGATTEWTWDVPGHKGHTLVNASMSDGPLSFLTTLGQAVERVDDPRKALQPLVGVIDAAAGLELAVDRERVEITVDGRVLDELSYKAGDVSVSVVVDPQLPLRFRTASRKQAGVTLVLALLGPPVPGR